MTKSGEGIIQILLLFYSFTFLLLNKSCLQSKEALFVMQTSRVCNQKKSCLQGFSFFRQNHWVPGKIFLADSNNKIGGRASRSTTPPKQILTGRHRLA